MHDSPATSPPGDGRLPLLTAVDLQDNLLTASHDLDRLQALLAEACDALMAGFCSATERVRALSAADGAVPARYDAVMSELGGAVTALQFQDMACQLIAHTHQRLRNCADRIAREAMGDDEEGSAVIEAPPLRPNPVTQDEMDAGSVELF